MPRRWMPCLLLPLLALIAGCPATPPGAGIGPGPGATALAEAPLPLPHPTVAALEEAPFAVPAFALSGRYPTNWTASESAPDANAIFQLRQGTDTYFSIGILPGMKSMVLSAAPEIPPEGAEDIILENAAQGVVLSENYFLGARKTVLNFWNVLFGEHRVYTVTQLIRRPLGGMAGMTPEELIALRLHQAHYLDLAPEGSKRLSRHYIWLLGEDIWIAQLVAPPATFPERSTEIEERLLPTLRFGSASAAATASP